MNSTDPDQQPFLWGVSTSGFQSEGGFNGSADPKNNWFDAEQSGRVARTGAAADFWNRYQEDFERSRNLGLNAFRMGIEWARVQPDPSGRRLAVPPPMDREAMDAYAERIAACRRAGLEPIITLQHFTHPAWLGIDAWLEDRTVDLFETFVSETVRRINEQLVSTHQTAPVRYFITINEPNILVQNTYLAPHFPGVRRGQAAAIDALNRLLSAHVRAYNQIHDLYKSEAWRRPEVTLNTFCSDSYWSDQVLLDFLCTRENGITDIVKMTVENSNALDAAVRKSGLELPTDVFVLAGRLLHRVVDWLAPRWFNPAKFAFFFGELARSPRERVIDYLGIDYYDPFSGHVFRPPSFADLEFPTQSPHAWLMDGMTSKWWDWRHLPEGLHFFCHYYANRYKRPILIAENGMALRRKPDNSASGSRRDRMTRSKFLKLHLAEIERLQNEGCPLLGYCHWSLTDNYEWGSFTPRFGLFTIDYAHGAKRNAVDHLGDNPSATYSNWINRTNRTST